METTPPTPTPLDLLRSLSAEEIESRLIDLRAEDKALRTILRSLRARDRVRQQSGRREHQEGRRA